ncbi:MAG: hypothetical protein KCHDKBKB_00086 [Elusimicrobia bacterium]|nr:hypothetical protein [Elusimicrobiota bacterium]
MLESTVWTKPSAPYCPPRKLKWSGEELTVSEREVSSLSTHLLARADVEPPSNFGLDKSAF